MTIFPANGVSPSSGQADCAFVPETEPLPSCPPRYYSRDCAQPISICSLNSLISEMLAVADACDLAWDCSKLTNLADAIACLIERELRVDAQEGITIDISGGTRFIELGDESFGPSRFDSDRFIDARNRALIIQAGDPGGYTPGGNSVTFGDGNANEGARSLVTGRGNNATGNSAITFGENNVTSANNAIVGGNTNNVSGNSAAVFGTSNVVPGAANMVAGNGNTVAGTTNLVGGADNVVNGSRNVTVGLNNTVDTNSALVIGNNNFAGAEQQINQGFAHNNEGQNSVALGNNNVINPGFNQIYIIGNFTTHQNAQGNGQFILGGAAVGPVLSSNRQFQVNVNTGDVQAAGTVMASAPFPGFGEYFLDPHGMLEGIFAATDDGISARPAQPDDVVIGVTRSKLAMSAGGGVDPANFCDMLDRFGNRVTKREMVDANGLTRAAWTQAQAARKAAGKEVESRWVPVGETDFIVPNPRYDCTKAPHEKIGVEFIGRCFVRVDKTVTPNCYVACGVDGIGTKSTEKTSVRALSVSDGLALVLCRIV